MRLAAGNMHSRPWKEQDWCYRVPSARSLGAQFEEAPMLVFPPFYYAQGLVYAQKERTTYM